MISNHYLLPGMVTNIFKTSFCILLFLSMDKSSQFIPIISFHLFPMIIGY